MTLPQDSQLMSQRPDAFVFFCIKVLSLRMSKTQRAASSNNPERILRGSGIVFVVFIDICLASDMFSIGNFFVPVLLSRASSQEVFLRFSFH
jgi:hypothetical protein